MKKLAITLILGLISTWAMSATGEETFKAVCANCHAQGLAGAPKVGDTKAWSKLIKEGQVPLTADGFNGVRAMPAKGGRAELTLPEFAAAVVHMANLSGAKWQEPDEAMLKKMNARVEKRNAASK